MLAADGTIAAFEISRLQQAPTVARRPGYLGRPVERKGFIAGSVPIASFRCGAAIRPESDLKRTSPKNHAGWSTGLAG